TFATWYTQPGAGIYVGATAVFGYTTKPRLIVHDAGGDVGSHSIIGAGGFLQDGFPVFFYLFGGAIDLPGQLLQIQIVDPVPVLLQGSTVTSDTTFNTPLATQG